ncbi:MAG: alginate export family protein [Pseudomonadota bacterium]|nr:alginate export family protein [Pseudomonadota bacterium]
MNNISYLFIPAIATTLLGMTAVSAAVAEERWPWRVDTAASLPDWLSISGSHRTRYASLDGQFRVALNGGDQTVALRTILLTEIKFDKLRFGVEVIDSRAHLNDHGSTLRTTLINPVELLQGYVTWHASNLFSPGDRSDIRAGRLTLDVGSRRLVARSLYRNTINTFAGVEWNWRGAAGRRFQAFYTLPVNRKPNTRADLLDNTIEFDEEDVEVRFWGIYYAFAELRAALRGEVFFLGLNEHDADGRSTRNREYYMPGLRIYRPPTRGRVDYSLESVFQFGQSRSSSTATNTRDLDHFAHFQHVEIGYTFDLPWSPRVIAQYDYASGDDDPTDGDNERFDTLFGARRFDFGPTGIYGPFLRNNLSTPGVRLKLKPTRDVKVFVAHRAYWLASDQDAWTTSGVRDVSGRSGNFIGHQIEARFRWEVLPGSYRFETGVAHLFAGEFMDDAPNANGEGDATYVYSQVLFNF